MNFTLNKMMVMITGVPFFSDGLYAVDHLARDSVTGLSTEWWPRCGDRNVGRPAVRWAGAC